LCCRVGHRCGSDPVLLWPGYRLAAVAPIGLPVWECPYAIGAALKKKKKKPNTACGGSAVLLSLCSTQQEVTARQQHRRKLNLHRADPLVEENNHPHGLLGAGDKCPTVPVGRTSHPRLALCCKTPPGTNPHALYGRGIVLVMTGNTVSR